MREARPAAHCATFGRWSVGTIQLPWADMQWVRYVRLLQISLHVRHMLHVEVRRPARTSRYAGASKGLAVYAVPGG